MVHFSSARLAMKSALANRIDDWSCNEREWLFDSLMDMGGKNQDQDQEPLPAQLQEDGGTIGQLKQYLMNRKDCPDGAFVVVIYE